MWMYVMWTYCSQYCIVHQLKLSAISNVQPMTAWKSDALNSLDLHDKELPTDTVYRNEHEPTHYGQM